MKTPVTVYTMTTCPYCVAAKKLLKKKGVEFEEVNLDEQPDRWNECESRSGRQTVPQIFFGDRHIGGCDDLEALQRSGELDKLIAAL
ncbi:MAG: glutaredoxin 3 [Acidobacteriota bacterium]